jgi:hypothetical protein
LKLFHTHYGLPATCTLLRAIRQRADYWGTNALDQHLMPLFDQELQKTHGACLDLDDM